MSKRYKLLQNWPDALIGDIYQWNGQGYSNQTRTGMVISKKYVEEFPSWFKELLPENKEFVWDDVLACEWAGYLEERLKLMGENEVSNIPNILFDWKNRKASKSYNWKDGKIILQPTEDNNQKIFWDESTIIELLQFMNSHYYGTIPSDKKQIIEQFKEYKSNIQPTTESPNKDYKVELSKPIEDKSKEWEVVSFKWNSENRQDIVWELQENGMYKNNFGSSWTLDHMMNGDPENPAVYCVENGRMKIFAVRRKSDSAVFSIGDEVEWGKIGFRCAARITSFYIDDSISNYYENNGNLYFDTDGKEHHKHIGFLSAHLLTKSKPQPKERIEVDRVYYDGNKTMPDGETLWYNKFSTTQKVPQEKLFEIKQAIEDIINKQ